MHRLFVGLVVAAATALVPMWAMAGNQEVAEQVAANLRDSGQLHGYKIGVKYQEGTAWLRGQVNSQEQMNAAVKLVFATPGVERVVNNLAVVSEETASPVASSQPKAKPGLTLGKVQNAITQTFGLQQPKAAQMPKATQPATSAPTQSLRQLAGAVAPEARPRSAMVDMPASRSMGSPYSASVTRLQRVASTAPATTGRADRVAASFAPTPVQPTSAMAMEEPRVVPPPPMPVSQQQAAVMASTGRPIPVAYTQAEAGVPMEMAQPTGAPMPQYAAPMGGAAAPASYDQPHMPNYSWPGYAAYPNYAGVTYPKQYSPTAWPYIGPFYPYPQVPLGWRKVTLEWHDGWWNLDFDDGSYKGPFSGLFRPCR